jgi:hypothetical protein
LQQGGSVEVGVLAQPCSVGCMHCPASCLEWYSMLQQQPQQWQQQVLQVCQPMADANGKSLMSCLCCLQAAVCVEAHLDCHYGGQLLLLLLLGC